MVHITTAKLVAGLVLGERYIDQEVKCLRRIYESTQVPAGEALKLGMRFLRNSIFGKAIF